MTNVIAVLILLLLVVLAFYLWRFLMVRGMRTVIALFRRKNAVNCENAVPLEALGLQPLPLMRRLMRPRDYKRPALQFLGQQGIIKMVEGNKFYLDESALKGSRLTRYLSQD